MPFDAEPPAWVIDVSTIKRGGPRVSYPHPENPPPEPGKRPLCFALEGQPKTCGPITVSGLGLATELASWETPDNQVANPARYQQLLEAAQANGASNIEIKFELLSPTDFSVEDLAVLKPSRITHIPAVFFNPETHKLTLLIRKIAWPSEKASFPSGITNSDAIYASLILSGAVNALAAQDFDAATLPRGPRFALSTKSSRVNWQHHLNENGYANNLINFATGKRGGELPLFTFHTRPTETSHHFTAPSRLDQALASLRRDQLNRSQPWKFADKKAWKTKVRSS